MIFFFTTAVPCANIVDANETLCNIFVHLCICSLGHLKNSTVLWLSFTSVVSVHTITNMGGQDANS